MNKKKEEYDKCSYISRMSEPTCESQYGCFCTIAAAVIIIVVVLFLCGCSTSYVALLRHEYNENGKIVGLYNGEKEYPVLYPATRIAATIEVPTWWWPGETKLERKYQLSLWPIGAVFSLLDVPISILSDTIMLPYDLIQKSKTNNLEDG